MGNQRRERSRPKAGAGTANKFKIQNSRFKISCGPEPVAAPQPSGGGLRLSRSDPPPGPAAGCCAHLGAIHYSKLRGRGWGSWTLSDSGCSLRSARKFGYELRASAAPRLRPADLLRGRIYSIEHRQMRAVGCYATDFVPATPSPTCPSPRPPTLSPPRDRSPSPRSPAPVFIVSKTLSLCYLFVKFFQAAAAEGDFRLTLCRFRTENSLPYE